MEPMTMAMLASMAYQAYQSYNSGSSDESLEQVPTKSPKQEKFASEMIDMLNKMKQPGGGYGLAENYYNSMLGPDSQKAFNQFSAPYMNQFKEQILPEIAERFAGVGALSSSGFGQALGGAASNLQSQLAQLFSGLQSQAAGANYNQFNQMSQTGLNFDPFAYYQQPGGGGAANGFAQGFNPATMQALVNMGKGDGNQVKPQAAPVSMPKYQPGPNTSGPYNLPTFMGR